MTMRKAIRWAVVIALTGVATLLAVSAVGRLVFEVSGCSEPQSYQSLRPCILFVQLLLPFLSIVIWAAASVYFIRALK